VKHEFWAREEERSVTKYPPPILSCVPSIGCQIRRAEHVDMETNAYILFLMERHGLTLRLKIALWRMGSAHDSLRLVPRMVSGVVVHNDTSVILIP
jgi:hypothetical protein